jgi:hypothetical protein
MEAVRSIQKIDGTTLIIDELSRFIGRECEIIILPVEKEEKRNTLPLPRHKLGIKRPLSRNDIYDNER